MTTRFTAPIGAEPTNWTKPPSAEQIDAVGRALPDDTEATAERQQRWFGAVVFDKPPTYRRGMWYVGDTSFSSQQVAEAVASGQRLEAQ